MGFENTRISSDYSQDVVFTNLSLGKRFFFHLIGLFVVNKLATREEVRVCSQAGSCVQRVSGQRHCLEAGAGHNLAPPTCATGMEGKAPHTHTLLGEPPWDEHSRNTANRP